ncbi:peptidase inhibitor I9 [Gelidibacter sediminis]|uniref:Peptidase inhibitor I9 n=1 Tax=Gelidibacter sediminis TaxID=1608710 RepID=A0A4R7Q7R9_9FLAO|nr:S8 family peptidase [Gelidibacter sediminis]TDU42760.1 peptidase inhibitor I9 [Gelidibacter sediminis]
MKIKSILKYSLVGVLSMTLINCQTDSNEDPIVDAENVTFEDSQPIPGSYIIVYNDIHNKMAPLQKAESPEVYERQMQDLKAMFVEEFKLAKLTEASITQTFGHVLNGFAANLSDEQLRLLKGDSRVKSIERDMTIKISPYKGKPGSGGSTEEQQLPYGTIRVGGGTTASSHTAWVIDSGVDLDHPDLNVDVTRSRTFLGGNSTPDDQNGHGTHVAGTIGALNNSIGSVGVAPGTLIVAVRVLDRRGSGSTSGVIAGVDYVAANANSNDVANMSLGGGVSTALDNAVLAASSSLKFALAAGNESDDANNHSPARVNGNNIYTISAMNSSDNWASFSNYGSAVDYCAPGVSVYSTWKNGGYNSISGTSMAAPHAAGVLLLGNPSSDGTVNGDPDGNPDPIIHN